MTKNHHSQSNFIGNIQRILSGIIDVILNHPYIEALEKKQIAKEKLEIFVCEQYHIVANDERNFALMISKASDDRSSKLFTACLHTELNALEKLTLMAEELNIDDKRKIDEYGPLAGCQSYTNYLTKLAVYSSDAEILTAILVDFPVWGANCDKMSSALKKNYGFTNTSCAFLDNFAAPLPREFVEKSNDIVGPALKTKEKEMRIAARLLLGYELSFWDTINKHSAIPD
jgi:thiaminase